MQTEEVKPDKFVDADLYRKLGLINEAMLSQRWPQLTLVKASQFDVGDRIRNVRILYGYRRGQVRTPVIQTFISSLPSSLALGELRARARSIKDLPKSLPLTIIANGIYTFDLSVRYSDDTVLERCQ